MLLCLIVLGDVQRKFREYIALKFDRVLLKLY